MDGQAKVQLILELKDRMKTGMTRAKENLNSNVSGMKEKLSELKNHHVKAFDAMEGESAGFGRVMQLMGNPYSMVAAGLLAVMALGVKAAAFSNEWSNGMAKVNVTAQLSRKELGLLSDKMIDIGKRNVMPLDQIPDAFNQIISAGLSVPQSLAALEPTLRAAKAGFTDVYTVANAGTSVMLASGENINKVYDIMFATLNKGKAEFKDMANYLPKAVASSKGLGLQLYEVGGAFATLSQKFKAEQVSTMLENVYKSFGTGKIRKDMESFGVKVFDKGKIRPFVSIIEDIGKSVKDLTPEGRSNVIEKMGFDMESRTAILSMITNVQDLKKNTDYAANSAGEMGRAYANAKQKLDGWNIMSNQFKAEFVLPLGKTIMKIAEDLGNFLLAGKEKLDSFMGFNNNDPTGKYEALREPSKLKKNEYLSLQKKLDSDTMWYQVMAAKSGKGSKEQLGYSDAYWQLKNLSKSAAKAVSKENPFAPDTPVSGVISAPGEPAGSGSGTGIDKITNSAQPARSITVNIDSFVKGGINTQKTTLQQMDSAQLEAWFKDMFLRVIANMETSSQ